MLSELLFDSHHSAFICFNFIHMEHDLSFGEVEVFASKTHKLVV
jgi:hypothetical protein